MQASPRRTNCCGMVWIPALGLAMAAGVPPVSGQTISAEAMFPIHQEAAKDYKIYTTERRDETLQLNEQPLFVWTNPRRARGQVGHLFVWMDGKYPAVVGTFFSFPWQGNPAQQRLVHELHALAESQIFPVNDNAVQKWAPKAGTDFFPLPVLEDVPETASRRLLRLRQLARSFGAHTVDRDGNRWDLRLLGKELMTYDGPERMGAMFAMLGDVGADPELLLLIEAKRHDGDWQWRFAPIRMTDQEIFLNSGGQEVWASVRSETNTIFYNDDHTYFRFQDALHQLSVTP